MLLEQDQIALTSSDLVATAHPGWIESRVSCVTATVAGCNMLEMR